VKKPAGNYEFEFNGLSGSGGRSLQSGVYFYKFKAGSFIEIKKMVLLR
jgi:hypothetical protein